MPWMGATTVTNAELRPSSRHRLPPPPSTGVSAVFYAPFRRRTISTRFDVPGGWPYKVRTGAINGPGSNLAGLKIRGTSLGTTLAYCTWSAPACPRSEWEYAARAVWPGTYAWGDELTLGGEWNCNIWQGRFPRQHRRGRVSDTTSQDLPAQQLQVVADGRSVLGMVPRLVRSVTTLTHLNDPRSGIRGPPGYERWIYLYRLLLQRCRFPPATPTPPIPPLETSVSSRCRPEIR